MMNIFESRSSKRALLPFTVANWIFGVGVVEYPVGHRHPILSAGWSVVHFVCVIASLNLAEMWSLVTFQKTRFDYKIYAVVHLFTGIHDTIFLYHGQTKSKKISECLNEMRKVDEALEGIGIFENHERTFKFRIVKVAAILILPAMLPVLPLIYNTDSILGRRSKFVFIGHIYHSTTLCLIVRCTFVAYVECIRKRLSRLNNGLQNAVTFKDLITKVRTRRANHRIVRVLPASTYRATSNQQELDIVRRVRDGHRTLCRIAEEINEAYGLRLMLLIPRSILAIGSSYTVELNMLPAVETMPTDFEKIVKTIEMFVWIAIHFGGIFHVCYVCTKTSTQAHRTVELTYKLLNSNACTDLKAEVEAFSLEVMFDPLRFTGYNFFVMNLEFIGEMAASIFTFLLLVKNLYSLDRCTNASDVLISANNSTM